MPVLPLKLYEGQELVEEYGVRDCFEKANFRNRNLYNPALDVDKTATGHSPQPLSPWPTDSRTSEMLQSDWPPHS